MNFIAEKTSNLKGEVVCPGDKSISQRILMIGSLLDQDIEITGFLNALDPLSTLNALSSVGVKIKNDNTKIKIFNKTNFISPKNDINLGNSGTGMRLMMGFISGLSIDANLVGDHSLSKRPMMRVANPLNDMGSNITCTNDLPPVLIKRGNIVNNYKYELPIASAQVKSSILLAALTAKKNVTVIEPSATRDHTEKMIKYFNGDIESHFKDGKNHIKLLTSNLNSNSSYEIVGDFSSASFLIVACLISKNSRILIKNVGLNKTRSGLINLLKKMGANINIVNQSKKSNEDVGDLEVFSSELVGVDVPEEIIPNIIDEIPIFSIAASFANGETSIKGASELRVKESDRLQAIADGLKALNVKYELYDDGIKIFGQNKNINPKNFVNSYGDHRIAMSFLIASLRSNREIMVEDCENILTSFPNFIETMNSLGMKIYEK